MKARKAAIKSVILNQVIMSGVGKIYADESLWRAKIHPEIPACDLSVKKIGSLVDAAVQVMAEAVEVGGTSSDAMYINVNGESGFFETSLAAYGQEGEPCPRCGRGIRRIACGNRSSHYCPKFQVKSSYSLLLKKSIELVRVSNRAVIDVAPGSIWPILLSP